MTRSEQLIEAVCVPLVTWIVKGKLPGADGVPLMLPPLKVNPGGRLPLEMDQA
jgi:hypothetical protein